MVHLDKHSTLDPVMASVATEGNYLLKPFENLNVNLGLKCKYDLIVKNSNVQDILNKRCSILFIEVY